MSNEKPDVNVDDGTDPQSTESVDHELTEATDDDDQYVVSDAPQDWQAQLEAAQAQAKKNYDDFLRSRAELDNQRKRAERDLSNAHKYALDKIAADLLAVRDSMELGLQAENASAEDLRKGTELTLKSLVQVMERYGIKVIDPMGEKFNPDLHQAMSMQESTEVEPNHVLLVMQKGYTLNDRLIRPALVAVSKAPA